MGKIEKTLDGLLEDGYITDYNSFSMPFYEQSTTLSINHMHESCNYLLDLVKEITDEYLEKDIAFRVRLKKITTKWQE